ncbi:hypothetical protein T459_13755 [Capsicum annuum]|uniref:Uncharacterized protein n=1 Tax=Capsicum annuum TaxID=4072 RepID=A0A2G2ZFH0_CAPAN|nr:putative type I inositol 1,4,5-trisphosphate 5-phosphatase 12-like isoform X1 [Capsicum annuum]PHT80740.1 hypothetical protein T459_13755 [Capsicum annuum]
MDKQQSFRNGAMEKQKSFKGIMEKQKNFRIVMERQMSFGGGERKRGKDSPGKRGDSLLHLATRAGNLGKVKEIFQKFKGKGMKDLLCQQNQEGETALYVAAKNGNSLVISEFLKYLDLKTASIMANNGYDALHVAARQDSNVLERILFTVLSILKSESFSRNCLVAAGVTFCVALHVCLSPEELGLFIMEGIFNESFIVCPKFAFADVVEKISFKGNLIDELSKFSSLSRLCLVWVILTTVSRTVLYIGFVVSNDNFGSVMDSGDSRKSIKMILYDAILLELCSFCENPIDSHFSFHALAVMQICLQQVKTSMVNKNGSVDVNYDPISEDMGTRLLQVVWNNLEDPLSQTVKQVHLIFYLFSGIQASLP